MSTPKATIEALRAAGLARRIPEFHPKPLPKPRNGVNAFVLQLGKLYFHYDIPTVTSGGSSKGMVNYIKTKLPQFAQKHPSIECIISRRPRHHPCLRGVYMNGKEKVICVKNFDANQIAKKVERLRTTSGFKVKRFTSGKPVLSDTPSPAGLWDPLTASSTFQP